jgi:co-chaperonin GroES (HSP10)
MNQNQQKTKKNQNPKVNNNFDITKFVFLGDLVLIKALRAESGDGKLVDPTQYEDKPEFGEVVKLGERKLKVGDIVRFGKYSTEAIRTKGADYFLVHQEDVSGYLPE